ncbi:hypothetical protein GYMLUDRAFT_207154 [Collybiopsis luxurians FD-317 M1]|uniref:DUF6534 domain-containing protein n=1 Tax=Collybiopsis luxurians FD-317 M1 TaxID=944289 RepID=A0A0D0BGN2_9AGAR|nr:hypothetical protein GYMLUDRAFT_207154 [Collybiopsis luxurians FD-317 M1]
MVHVITPPPTDPSRDDIIWLAGPRFIGILFNWSLLGILTVQVYIFYLNFPKDSRLHKALVYVVYLLDWAQTCLATYDAFNWFVYGWGNLPALYQLYSSFLNIPILSSVIALIVQVFFGWRIWRLSQSRVAFGLVIVLALLQMGGGIAVGVFLWRDSSEVTRSDGLVRAVGIRLGGSAFVDTVIAISMTYYLVRSKSEVMGHMNNVVTRLIRLTIETGTATAIAALIDLVFFLKEHNGLHQVSGVTLCKLYSNTLLVLFNNRMIMAASKGGSDTHYLSGGGSSNYTSDDSHTLETFRAAPRLSALASTSIASKGEWGSDMDSIPLEDLSPTRSGGFSLKN